MERNILSDPQYFKDLVECMSKCRSHRRICLLLGISLEAHPQWSPAMKSSSKVITELIYRLDSSAQYKDVKQLQKKHDKAKARAIKDAEAHVPKPKPPRRNLQEALLSQSFLAHFRAHCKASPSDVYALPRACFGTGPSQKRLADMSMLMAMPAAAQHQREADDLQPGIPLAGHQAVVAALAEPEHPGAHLQPLDGDKLFFRVVHGTPASQKTVRVAPGAGRHLHATDIAIAIVDVRDSAGHLSAAFSSQGHRTAQVTLLSNFNASMPDLQNLERWSSEESVTFALPGFTEPCALAIVTAMVHCAAFEPGWQAIADRDSAATTAKFYDVATSNVPELAILRRLEAFGFVEARSPRNNAVPWRFTLFGASRLIAQRNISNPQPALNPRQGLPLSSMSDYELLALIFERGWAVQILPKAKAILLVYRTGAPKTFYIAGAHVVKSYLLCLIAAETAPRARNVQHGNTATWYAKLLRQIQLDGSDDEVPAAQLEDDLQPDLQVPGPLPLPPVDSPDDGDDDVGVLQARLGL
jgi:hypothetical protein